MEINYCFLVIFAALFIWAGNGFTSAKKEKMVMFSSPFFSSNFQESKERLKTKHIFETEVNECSNPKAGETTTEETPTMYFESSPGSAFTTRENELATTTKEYQETKSCDHTTVPTTKTTKTTKTGEKSATVAGTTAATTTSQIETTTMSSTEEDTTTAGRMSSSKLPVTTHDAYVTSSAAPTTQSPITVQSDTTIPTTKTAGKPATVAGTTAATTTSQIETTTISSTEGDNTSAGRMSSSKLPVTTHDAVTSSAAPTTQSPSVQNCHNENWTFWNDSCYKLFGDSSSTKKKWYDAKQGCESSNAHLIVIERDEENHFITETLLTDPQVGAWIGLKREGVTWKWHYGNTETIPVDDAKQPSCTSNQKCIFITKDDINSWQCGTCNDYKPFICEVEK